MGDEPDIAPARYSLAQAAVVMPPAFSLSVLIGSSTKSSSVIFEVVGPAELRAAGPEVEVDSLDEVELEMESYTRTSSSMISQSER